MHEDLLHPWSSQQVWCHSTDKRYSTIDPETRGGGEWGLEALSLKFWSKICDQLIQFMTMYILAWEHGNHSFCSSWPILSKSGSLDQIRVGMWFIFSLWQVAKVEGADWSIGCSKAKMHTWTYPKWTDGTLWVWQEAKPLSMRLLLIIYPGGCQWIQQICLSFACHWQ
jgi:hypothetical protein